MADEKDMAVVETSMANPKQAVNVLENLDKVTATSVPTQTLQNDPALFKQQENNAFFDSEAWADYKSDMLRAYKSKRYPAFASIETTAENPAYTSIINRYGEAIANRAQAMHSAYVKADSWIGRLSDAYNVPRYSMRAAVARKELSNAILSGDEAKIARAKLKYQNEQRNIYERGMAYDESGNTIMSLAASMGRNPELIPIEVAGAIFAPATGGATEYAARAINAAIIGADTYTVEAGSALEELDKEFPNLSEAEKHGAAKKAGAINAAIEAGLFSVGGNVLGRGATAIGTETAIRSTMRAVKKETGEKISRDAAKEMLKVKFIKTLQKPAEEESFKSTLKEISKDLGKSFVGEGGQEVWQNEVTKSMINSIKNGTTLTEELLDDWMDFLVDPFGEQHADKWETFINVGAASLVFGGGFQVAAQGIRRIGVDKADTTHSGLGDVQDKALGAYNNTLGLSRLFSWHKNSDAKNALGASNAVLQNQIERGEVSGKLYTTVEQVQEMQQDPEIAEALDQMGIANSLSEAADNGGVVEIDLLAYDKVVNESQNTTLFQKMRNYLSFSDTTMSINEFNQFINSKGKEVAAMISEEVKNDQESIYNKLKAMALKAGRTAERAEGYAVLGHLLLSNLQSITKGEKNNILERLKIQLNNTDGGAIAEERGQQVQYKGKKRNMFGDVYTANGKQVKYMGIDGEYITGVNRAAMTDDSSVKVVKMSPSWFLSLTPYKMGSRDVSNLENVINNGEEIAMPFLTVEVADADKKTLRVIGHEGRHRSLAMRNLGVNNGYVVLESKDFYRHPELFKDGIANWRIIPQEGALYSDDLFTVEGDARDDYVDVGGMVDAVFTEGNEQQPRVYHMFVGSRTADKVNVIADALGKRKELDQARTMYMEAVNRGEEPDYEAIWEKTGWYFNEDGSWSYEISDAEAKLKTDIFTNSRGKVFTGVHTSLGRIWDNDALYDVIPWAKDVHVHVGKSNISGKVNSGGSIAKWHAFTRNGKTVHEIIINATKLAEALKRGETVEHAIKSEIVHELQHAVQYEQGMMRTQNTGSQISQPLTSSELSAEQQQKIDELYKLSDAVKEIVKKYNLKLERERFGINALFGNRDKILKAAQTEEEKQAVKDFVDKFVETKDYNYFAEDDYYRRPHELQARNNQYRLSLTAEQRKVISPSATKDIAGKTRVGYAANPSQLRTQTREINVIKFAGVPAETTTQQAAKSTEGLVEAGRTTAQAGQYEIALTPDANVVTFAHELFHVFSLELQRVYNEGTITDFWKAEAEKMFKIAGAKPEVDPADPTVVRYNLTEAQEEYMANLFTNFIAKGKIENREIRGLLSKLVDMFKTVYRQLEGSGLTQLALDKKSMEFFNTVISSQQFIEDVQRDAGLFEIAQPEGADRELYDYYIANLAASKVEASNDLRRKLFKIEEFKNSPEYTKLMQKFKDEAKAELLEENRYKILAQSSLYEGTDKAQQTLMWAENNMPEANYTLGDITEILEKTPSLEEASTKIAENEMEKYIAKEYNLTPQDIGFKEERNRAKVRALLAESVMQRGGKLADIEDEIKKADAASDKLLAKTSVYQIIDLGKWKNREAAAVERYSWARQQGRKDLMSAERYNQAVLTLIMIKSNGFKSEYQKMTALFEKLQSKQKKYQRKDEHGNKFGPYEHRYHADDWELLRSISEKFGNKIRDGRRSTKTVHQQLKEWITTQVENRFSTVASLEQFLPFIDKGSDGSIGALKGKDFKKLWAVMHTIDSIAMREQQLFLDGQYEEMNEYVADTLDFINKMEIKTDTTKVGGKYFGRYGTWQNPEPLLRAIFPEKVFQKIFLPMFNGAFKAEAQAKKWIKTWKQAKAQINTSNEAFIMDDGTQITYGDQVKKTMTYGDVANLLIAMGAEHSYENYKLKFGLSDKQAEQIAAQAIKRNSKYIDFMNTTWKVYGEATEKLNSSFQERTNELFVRKEHRAFEINGVKFEGGYVPEDKHYIALVRELGTWNQGARNKVENKNEKLITKIADGDVLSIIDITETKLSQSAKWAYAAIPYNNVKKFIERKEIQDAMGDRVFNFIKDWLQNWDTPHFDESGVWRPLTRVTTIAALGARASTALLQLSGLAQAATNLGRVYMARGMLQFVRENGFFHPFKGPKSKSLYMETRVEDPFAARFGAESQGRKFREIFESYNAKSKLGKVGVGLLSAYQTLAMMGIQIVDGWVATITWNGAYARALDNGLTKEQAEQEADSIVRVTQSDASQISRSAAMQEPWARSVTAFATWTMAMRSQVAALSTSKHYRKDMAMWLASYAVLSSFIEAFLKEMTEPADDDEKDKEMLERVLHSWYNKIVEAVGTQAMPMAGLGAYGAKALAGALVNTDDEKIFKAFTGGGVPALQYATRAVDAGAQSIMYMRSGDEEDLNKLLIKTSGLVSYELKKRVKQALED